MIKIEIICETCDEHFIIVTKDNEPEYCPFCTSPIPDKSELEFGDGE